MANTEHLAILKQGVEVWNTWRQEHPDVQPDISGADLEGAILVEANLSGVDCTGVHLRGADLFGADLRGANLHAANLFAANLFGAQLTGADLSETKGLTRGQIESAITGPTTKLPDYLKSKQRTRR